MTLYNRYRQQVDEGLHDIMNRSKIPNCLRDAMAYSLLSEGKRLRPILLLAAYNLKVTETYTALPFALALEMIHAYSLIHDDLPAMDNDDYRRGKCSNHKVFGEDIAILSGDGLLNLAYETMLRAALNSDNPLRALKVIDIVASRAGATGMVGGQALEIEWASQTQTPDKREEVHARKTADLFIAAVESGLRLADALQEEIEAGVHYGFHFGMAFQLIDDLTDASADLSPCSEDDRRSCKKAGGVLSVNNGYLMENAISHINMALDALSVFGNNGKFLRTLAKDIVKRLQ